MMIGPLGERDKVPLMGERDKVPLMGETDKVPLMSLFLFLSICHARILCHSVMLLLSSGAT